MKIGHFFQIAGVVVFALDTFAQGTVSNPTGIDSTVGKIRSFYAPLDEMLPGPPLWLYLIGIGTGLNYWQHKSLL